MEAEKTAESHLKDVQAKEAAGEEDKPEPRTYEVFDSDDDAKPKKRAQTYEIPPEDLD